MQMVVINLLEDFSMKEIKKTDLEIFFVSHRNFPEKIMYGM